MSLDTYDYLFKIIIIGDASTGKSCLLHRFIEDKFKRDSSHTIGVEFGSKIIEMNNKSAKLQIWDTAGQERFRSVTKSYYRGSAGALIVYDVTSKESYEHLTTWLSDARTLAGEDISIILVGNKLDRNEERSIPFMEASKFAQDNNILFMEASALTGEGVEEVFLKCTRSIMTKIETGVLSPSLIGPSNKSTIAENEGEKSFCGC
eukprot:TRINITY_DN4875_c1_g2_i1.p1 TRINITY_DN4875_c1_g2~~TRINITY_DN4875_c1_g2_i1.p1  ORF type:complete len:205 (-),score=50.20 TRINITY_DN4875_c1_g2_i1:136-750(-)